MYGKSKLLWGLLASMLSTKTVHAEDVTTIVETHTITPDWFSEAIETALSGQPHGIDEGIRIVFVNGDAPQDASQAQPTDIQTYLTTSNLEYTVSSDNTVYTTTGPVVITTTSAKAPGTSTTTGGAKAAAKSSSSKRKSTIYEIETETENSNVYTQITKKAKTTTKTVFEAKTTPSTSYVDITETPTVTTTEKNPLATVSAVSLKRPKTISVGNKDTTIENSYSSAASADASSDVAAAKAVTTDPASSSIATIDLRIDSSTIASILSASSAAAVYSSANYLAKFSNGTTSSSSDYSLASASEAELAVSTASASESASASASKSASSSVAKSSIVVASSAAASSTSVAKLSSLGSGDLFEVISTSSPPSVFAREELPLSIPDGVDNDGVPFETNKFYLNLFLSEQTDMIWSYPYGLYWKKTDYYGIGVQHTDPSKRVFGDKSKNTDGDTYFYNPTSNAELLISAKSLTEDDNNLGIFDQKSMSVNVKLSASSSFDTDYVEIPIVQGMGFVTAIYHGDMVVELNSLYGVSSITEESSDALPSTTLKYRVTLFNNYEYLVYVTLPSKDSDFSLSADDSYHIYGSKAVDGLIIQMAYAPTDSDNDGYYDEAAGLYPVSASISGSASGTSASYSFTYNTKGSSSSGNTILFALPHHVESFADDTAAAKTPISLTSTTKGNMTAILANEINLSETLYADVQFLPWGPAMSSDLSYTEAQLKLLAKTAQSELDVDIKLTVANGDSNYGSGKLIDKYANLLLVVHDIIGDDDFAEDVLADLKDAFDDFLNNEQYYPLMYDTKFGGVTSTASQDGDTGADYGSGYYNDHHFHYGYFVHAAAVVGYVDKKYGGTWAEDNKDWVNSLIRDVANPSEDDSYFPVSRMFDWFAGHSWAGGLFTSGDGRNEESSSEDYHFSYGMKLWGQVIEDSSMEGRGDLMLAVMKRAMNKYFYFSDDNDVVPSEMVPNKVTGILFDNKIAFTTYFGDGDEYPQYVHGIHMLPMTAAAALIRGTDYTQQEWDQTIASFVDDLTDGWAGILRLNQALFDPEESYKFFSADDFDSDYLDNGLSRTWALAFSGGLSS